MLICMVVTLIGFGPKLTTTDTEVLNSAKKRCGELYPDSPCLKTLIKKKEGLYNAICAGKP